MRITAKMVERLAAQAASRTVAEKPEAYIAERLEKCRLVQEKITELRRLRMEAVERHQREICDLDWKIELLQQDCHHLDIIHHDGCGDMPSYDQCNICDKRL